MMEKQRGRITGVILATKWVSSQFGETMKMLVEVKGSEKTIRVWSTVPASILDTVTNDHAKGMGLTVSFTATITPSDRDESFFFANRPFNAVIGKQ